MKVVKLHLNSSGDFGAVLHFGLGISSDHSVRIWPSNCGGNRQLPSVCRGAKTRPRLRIAHRRAGIGENYVGYLFSQISEHLLEVGGVDPIIHLNELFQNDQVNIGADAVILRELVKAGRAAEAKNYLDRIPKHRSLINKTGSERYVCAQKQYYRILLDQISASDPVAAPERLERFPIQPQIRAIFRPTVVLELALSGHLSLALEQSDIMIREIGNEQEYDPSKQGYWCLVEQTRSSTEALEALIEATIAEGNINEAIRLTKIAREYASDDPDVSGPIAVFANPDHLLNADLGNFLLFADLVGDRHYMIWARTMAIWAMINREDWDALDSLVASSGEWSVMAIHGFMLRLIRDVDQPENLSRLMRLYEHHGWIKDPPFKLRWFALWEHVDQGEIEIAIEMMAKEDDPFHKSTLLTNGVYGLQSAARVDKIVDHLDSIDDVDLKSSQSIVVENYLTAPASDPNIIDVRFPTADQPMGRKINQMWQAAEQGDWAHLRKLINHSGAMTLRHAQIGALAKFCVEQGAIELGVEIAGKIYPLSKGSVTDVLHLAANKYIDRGELSQAMLLLEDARATWVRGGIALKIWALSQPPVTHLQ